MARGCLLTVLATLVALQAQPALAQGENVTRPCDDEPCMNGAACTNLPDDTFSCACPWGYFGELCEEATYWTLQQWQSNLCGGMPWRCFRLKMGECIDTGFTDGNIPNRKNWFGRLRHVNENGGLYTIDLCWGEGEEEGSTKDDRCNCEYHFPNIRRLGKNSLGPPTEGRESPDSDRCHKLLRITSSRLVNSTGMMTGDEENLLCNDPDSAYRSRYLLAVILSVFLAIFQ